MRRIKRLAAGLIAVAGLLAFALSTASASTIGGHQISDTFKGTTIDPTIWAFFGGNDEPAVSISQGGGALRFTIAANAGSDFFESATTRCSVAGDFDAQLTFELPQWTPNNGVWLMLMAANTGGFNVYRASWQFTPGDSYGAYLPPSGGATAPAETGNSGTIRLTRTGSTWTGYYQVRNTWVSLGSGPGPTNPVQLSVWVNNNSGVIPFAGNPTTIDVDRFRATADSIVC